MHTILKEPNLILGMSLYSLDTKLLLETIIAQVCKSNADAHEIDKAICTDQRYWQRHLKRKLRLPMAECKLIENRIYCRDRIFIPDDEELKLQILLNTHSSASTACPAKHKTINFLRLSRFRRGHDQDAARFVRNCYQ